MESRLHKNWLDGYMAYTADTEIPPIYSKWVGLSVLSSTVQKKVILYAGRLKIYPNLYIVLVGNPGTRKSEAVLHGMGLLQELRHINMSPTKCTTELLIHSMSKCGRKDIIMGKDTPHTSYCIISDEFESFLGYKGKNDSMIGFLTDIFGCGNPNFAYETISRGKDTLVNPYLTLLAATTPTSLANSLPVGAVGGGLTSRILFPTFSGKRKLVAFPKKAEDLKESLVHDLSLIHKYSAELCFSDEAREKWKAYYEDTLDSHDPKKRICGTPLFSYWYERKFLFIQKLTMLHAISANEVPVIKWKYFEQAIEDIEELEHSMGTAFEAVGENPHARKITLVRTFIQDKQFVTKQHMMSMLWNEMSTKELEEALNTLQITGDIVSVIADTADRKEQWYTTPPFKKELKKRLEGDEGD